MRRTRETNATSLVEALGASIRWLCAVSGAAHNNNCASSSGRLANLTLFKDCNTKGSYLYYHRWYEENLPSRRYLSRGLAVLVIVLGAILPIVVNWRRMEAHYKLAVSLIGALIIIAQGVSQTFAYDAAWRNFTMARIKLEVAHDA